MRWFIAVLFLFAAALVLESGLLAFATYVLLGVLVVSRVLARSWVGNLKASRTVYLRHAAPAETDNDPDVDEDEKVSLPARTVHAEIGDRVVVKVRVLNTGLLLVPWLILEDLVPLQALRKDAALKVRGKNLQLVLLRGGREKLLRYRLDCLRRGFFQVGPLVLEGGDLFGLHRRYRVLTRPHYVLVYPRVVPLQGYDLASRRPVGDVQLTHRLYEDPTRIAGVRAYAHGDPLNRIHWKATARAGALHSKIHEPSTLSGATLLLDFHEGSFPSRGEPVRSDLAVTAVASLANAVFEMGQQVGLVSNGRDAADRLSVEEWEQEQQTRTAARKVAAMRETSDRLEPMIVETRRGAEQVERIRELLARLELSDGLTFAALLAETVSRLPRDATLVAVLGDVPVDTALALGLLRRRGFAITVVLVLMNDEQLPLAHQRLLAEGVRDVRHVASEDDLVGVCTAQVQRGGGYSLV